MLDAWLTSPIPLDCSAPSFLSSKSSQAVVIVSEKCRPTPLGRIRVRIRRNWQRSTRTKDYMTAVLLAVCKHGVGAILGKLQAAVLDCKLLCQCLYIPKMGQSFIEDGEPIGTSIVAATAQSLSLREKSA